MAIYFLSQHDGERRYFLEQPDGSAQPLSAAPWAGGTPVGSPLDAAQSKRLPRSCPVAPSKIIGIGRNYADHARELNNTVDAEPLMFFKPPSSLLGPDGSVELPPESERVDFEGELGVIIGKRCRRVGESDAMAHVFGYCAACDVTARDLQKKDKQWTRAKGFDTFCPVGPEVVTDIDPSSLSIQLLQNDELRQNGPTSDMVFAVPQLVAYVSQSMTLEPGDLILTGTPAGVGPLHAGDRIRLSISGFADLCFSVRGAVA